MLQEKVNKRLWYKNWDLCSKWVVMTSEICYTLSTEVGHHFYPSFIVPTSVTVHHLYYFIHGCLGIISVRHRFYQTFYIHWMLEYIISSFLCKKSIGFIPDWPNSRWWSIYILFLLRLFDNTYIWERGVELILACCDVLEITFLQWHQNHSA